MKKKTQSYVIFFCCFGSVEQKIRLSKRFHSFFKNDLLLLKQVDEWIIKGIDTLKKDNLTTFWRFFVAIDALVKSEWKEKKRSWV